MSAKDDSTLSDDVDVVPVPLTKDPDEAKNSSCPLIPIRAEEAGDRDLLVIPVQTPTDTTVLLSASAVSILTIIWLSTVVVGLTLYAVPGDPLAE
ncbi:MAG: hypothetical protein ACREQ5_04735 [Candidatus Dormibacteria bacterium]